MGCCFSRSTGPNSPYPGGAPNSSARAINPPPLSVPESAHPPPSNAPQSPPRRRRTRRPLDQHIDKPLRRHTWTSKGRTWSRRELARERRDFFDTRVTGRPEVWQTLHAALEALWDSAGSEDGGAEGLSMAQTILSAAEISLPTGDLANGAYDSLGNYYALQEWIVCDPTNVVDEGDDDTKAHLPGGADNGNTDDYDDDGQLDETDPEESSKEGRGKAVVDVREQVTLRARLSESGRDCQVTVVYSESVRSVAKKVAEVTSLPPGKKIRLAYMGRILKENSSLEAQGWHQEHVVNALVFNR